MVRYKARVGDRLQEVKEDYSNLEPLAHLVLLKQMFTRCT